VNGIDPMNYFFMRRKSLCIRLILLLVLPGCSVFIYKDQEIQVPETDTFALPDTTEKKKRKIQVGKASWYGGNFHGKQTASGAIFDATQRTAAHRSLPFGSKVRVTRLDNNKSVVVEINDRGPFIDGRIIDLSHAAAEVLGMTAEGAVTVEIELLDSLSARQTTVRQ
jgi:rare lipoprotein A (peptidoglycan hydrolase)